MTVSSVVALMIASFGAGFLSAPAIVEARECGTVGSTYYTEVYASDNRSTPNVSINITSFNGGSTMPGGEYRLEYAGGYMAWYYGQFGFYTQDLDGRGFKVIYNDSDGTKQSVPIFKLPNGTYGKTNLKSASEIAAVYDDVDYEFYHNGSGPVQISFRDYASNNVGGSIRFKLTQIGIGNCGDTNDYDDNNDNEGDLDVSCDANRSRVETDEDVTFTADADGGNGTYRYSWSGTDGLSGSGRTVRTSYDDEGTKRATVRVTSGGYTATANCSVRVGDDYNNDDDYDYDNDRLTGSCEADDDSVSTGETVRWSVDNVDGGNGYYVYSWTGTDGLYGSGNSVRRSYNTSGTKRATVTIYSGGQSISRTCTVDVDGHSTGGPYYYNVYNSNQGGVSLHLDQTTGGNGGYVSLSNVPYTGLDNTTKIILLMVGLIFWSFVVTYVFVIKHRREQA